jgi:hypothetical protein
LTVPLRYLCCLERWLRLLDLPQVQVLWEKTSQTASYQWMLFSWSLLFIFQKWISTVKWLASRGFATVQDTHTQHFRVVADGTLSSGGPSGCPTMLLPTLEAFDTSFNDLWAHRIIIQNDPIWTQPLPPDQFWQASQPKYSPLPPSDYGALPRAPAPAPSPCQDRLLPDQSKQQRKPDFMARTALFEPCTPFQPGQGPMGYMVNNTDSTTQYPRLAATPGKEPCLICFRSSFTQPFNVCQFSSCIGNRRKPRETQRLHIDLAQEPWRSKPEAFWQPIVEWLQLPTMRPFIRPTKGLCLLTPSAKWSLVIKPHSLEPVAHPFVELDIDLTGDILPPIIQPTIPQPILSVPVSSTPAFPVPKFHHGPPSSILGRHHWPTAPETQAVVIAAPCWLLDTLVLITPFLDKQTFRTTFCLSQTFNHGVMGTSLSFT